MYPNINKNELARQLGTTMGWSNKKALSFINCFIDIIIDKLMKQKRVVLSGFGVFQLSLRKMRKVIHPITKKEEIIDQHYAPRFSMSSVLSKQINKKGQI